MNTKKLSLTAMLTAAALIIFVAESQIPPVVPIVGVKLGLANVITLVALYLLSPREAFFISIIRIVLGSIFTGHLMSFFFSLAGGLLCYAAMLFASKIFSKQQIWAVSVLGAIAHNAGQLCVALFMLGRSEILWYSPVLLLSALITGAFTGVTAQLVIHRFNKEK